MTSRYRLIIGCVLACGSSPLWAEDEGGVVTEIIVTAAPSENRVLPPSVGLSSQQIDERQPLVAADIVAGIAGISLRQNSRGETVLRVRSGEERQTPIFLDGAPLATPWDGRIDLGILPAGIIREVEVTRSAAPLEYGANAIAGVVDLRTASASDEDMVRAEVFSGSGHLFGQSAMVSGELGDATSATLAFSHSARDFQTIAGRSAIPFDVGAGSSDRRSNTDSEITSLFAALSHEGGAADFRLSLLHADANRGIPAEGHLDPALDRPRYWRYPLWRLTQLSGSGSVELGGEIGLRGTVWHQRFAQDIDSYQGDDYAVLDERESGRDRTFGGRLTLSGPLGQANWRLSASALTSTHRQAEASSADGTQAGLTNPQIQRFRQQFLSAGAELDIPLVQDFDVTLGLGMDASFTPLTGDKPAQPSATAPSFSATARYEVSGDVTLRASMAQRTRFATMREQFGQSLGRFLPNPGLRPERARTLEIGADWRGTGLFDGGWLHGDIALWLNDSTDTLGRRVVRVNGTSLRQRYNMRGAFTYGVEASATAEITDHLTAEFSAAFQGGKPREEAGNLDPRLVQRVNRQIGMAVDWTPTETIDLRAEYRHQGRAFDLAETGDYVSLPSSNTLSLRSFLTFAKFGNSGALQASLSLDNVTNALVLPQLGLPAPGRTFRIGLKLTH